MKPPWLGHSRDEADLEALQTDVMRFMAILGLCLTAIFSLVQGAAQEQAAVEQAAVEQAAVEQAAVGSALEPAPPAREPSRPIVQSSQTVQERPIHVEATASAQEMTRTSTTPTTLPSAPVVGFTLEFASVQALEMLLQDRTVQLYARHREEFWLVDTHGSAVPVEAPYSYYQMHSDTVPHRLRDSLPDAATDKAITWGVTLPVEAIGQIQQLTKGRKGGNLLIGYDGVVALEGTSISTNVMNYPHPHPRR